MKQFSAVLIVCSLTSGVVSLNSNPTSGSSHEPGRPWGQYAGRVGSLWEGPKVLQSWMEKAEAGLKDSIENKSTEVQSKSRAPKSHGQLSQEWDGAQGGRQLSLAWALWEDLPSPWPRGGAGSWTGRQVLPSLERERFRFLLLSQGTDTNQVEPPQSTEVKTTTPSPLSASLTWRQLNS